jgi:hypothetical protein
MRFFWVWMCLAQVVLSAHPRSVQDILADYTKAVGGSAAVDRITSRQTEADIHLGGSVTLFWQKPHLVLEVSKRLKAGFDGRQGWRAEKKKKVEKLARGGEKAIESDANPLRYVYLEGLYEELSSGPSEEIDGEPMEVLLAPNSLGATKLFFSSSTHLLRRVEERGETSAYFKLTVDYFDYREVDGIRLPYRIVHRSTEPNSHGTDLRVKSITHNVEMKAELFSRP